MYQSIDDTELETTEPPASARGGWLWPALAALVAIAAVFALVFIQSPGRPAEDGETLANTKSRAAYTQAISEPTAALRRARLQDFLRMHPTDTHVGVVQTQLALINEHEAKDWAATVRKAYAPKITREEKQSALGNYAAKWNPNLLGGRGDEFTALRAEVMGMEPTLPLPDRRLVEGQSPIPSNINANELAGGPAPAPEPPRMVTILPEPPPRIEVPTEIIGPTIRRNVKPRYPRKALRRRVDGVVTLSMDIDIEGKVQTTEIIDVKAERYTKDFIKAAERAAMRTRFHPKTIDGKPVPALGVLKRYRFEAGRGEE